MQVIVDSILTHYEREGKGRPVMLLHGWGDSAAGLRALRLHLSKKYDVIAVDLPGFGETQPPHEAWGLNEYIDFIQHFLNKIGEPSVWALIGHSNGGAMAIRGLANRKLQAEKLVLLSSAGVRGAYKGRIRAFRILAKTGKVLAAPLPKRMKNKLRRKVYKTIGSDMLVVEHMQQTFKRVVTDDVRADAAQLDLPVLLIYGEADEDTPLWYGEQFHELIGGSTLEILPNAGHFVHLDRPQDVERAISEFLK